MMLMVSTAAASWRRLAGRRRSALTGPFPLWRGHASGRSRQLELGNELRHYSLDMACDLDRLGGSDICTAPRLASR